MKAFTLIELLIVVAIIAILAAIAVPNFLEAQTRAKVSRCMSDMRSLVTAIESYAVDHSSYAPYGRVTQGGIVEPISLAVSGKTSPDLTECFAPVISTPIAYVTAVPKDPFMKASSTGVPLDESGKELVEQYNYINMKMHLSLPGALSGPPAQEVLEKTGDWRLIACGPDCDRGYDCKFKNLIYDPTNGTVSDGDIVRTQRNPQSVAR